MNWAAAGQIATKAVIAITIVVLAAEQWKEHKAKKKTAPVR